MRYVLNGFLLVVPLLALNAALASRLPAGYRAARWNDVPATVTVPENVLRLATMVLSLLLPISLAGPIQRIGAALYLAGSVAYVASWLVQIWIPASAWSTGVMGFLAPAYTPALWLAGIGLLGSQPVIFHTHYLPWVFLGTAAAFLVWHNLHAALVYRPPSDYPVRQAAPIALRPDGPGAK